MTQGALFDARGLVPPDAEAVLPCCLCGGHVPPDYVMPDRPRHDQICPVCLDTAWKETRARRLAEQADPDREANERAAELDRLTAHVTPTTARAIYAAAQRERRNR